MPRLRAPPKRPLTSWAEVPPSFGNAFITASGRTIRRGDAFSAAANLPAVLHPTRVVQGDLIPRTSWGASLSNLLTKKSWDALRHPLIALRSNACELCGIGGLPSFDVHEVWSYRMPSDAVLREALRHNALPFGQQSLDGLMVLCKKCHACFHLGLAQFQGRLPMVLARLRALNRWSPQELNGYVEDVFRRHHAHSRVGWILDFTKLQHPEGGLVLQRHWKPLRDGSGLLNKGDQFTGIANIPWKFSQEAVWRPARGFDSQ